MSDNFDDLGVAVTCGTDRVDVFGGDVAAPGYNLDRKADGCAA